MDLATEDPGTIADEGGGCNISDGVACYATDDFGRIVWSSIGALFCVVLHVILLIIHRSCSCKSEKGSAGADVEERAIDAVETVAPHVSECVLRLLVPETECIRNARDGARRQMPFATPVEISPVGSLSPAGLMSPIPSSTPKEGDLTIEDKTTTSETAEEEGTSSKTAAVVPSITLTPAYSAMAEDDAREEKEGSWALLDTLCENTKADEAERFWSALLRALGVSKDGSSSSGARVVVHAMLRSIASSTEMNSLLRTNDMYSKAYAVLTRLVGEQFLDNVLKQTFQELLEPTEKVFTCSDLLQLVTELLARTENVIDTLDPAIVSAVGVTYTAVVHSWPSPEEYAARSAASTLLFLRYMSSGIACPAAIQDAPPGSESDDDLRVRALLTLLAKMFQVVVNGAIAPGDDDVSIIATAKMPASTFGVCRCECGNDQAHANAVIKAVHANRPVVRRILERVITRHQQLQWDLAEQQSVLVQAIALGSEEQAANATELRRQQAAADVVRFLAYKFDSIENPLSLRDPHVTVQVQELVGKVTGKL